MERVVLTATGVGLQPEDIIVSRAMIEVGLAVWRKRMTDHFHDLRSKELFSRCVIADF